MKISIITPSYNQGRFIEGTINSVIGQDYDDFEYIIIDGGSNDNTVEIIKRYAGYLSYWESKEDRGQSHAINKGLKRATGDIATYLNSDDILLENALKSVNEFFNLYDNADIIYGDGFIIDENSTRIKKRREIPFDYVMGCMIGFGIIMLQPSTFFRSNVIEKIGYFNEDLHFSMDEEFWFRCISNNCHVMHVRTMLSGFRWHQDSKTKTSIPSVNRKRIEEKCMMLEKGYNTLPISKVVPFRYSGPVRKLYRIRRILKKLIFGCYF